MKRLSLVTAALLTGCAAAPIYPPRVYVVPPVRVIYQTPPPQPVVSVYIDPPLYQPAPVRVQWAPPPMLVETVPYQPYPDAIWTGGYWVWEGNWVWAHGRWSSPPQPGYGWVNPYYENRGGSVLFVNGFWAGPGVSFVQPAMNIQVGFAQIAIGVIAGIRPIGPDGIFVPAPPGSRLGLIIPAPLGTAPAVVISAPPVINEGMRIRVNNNSNNTINNNSTTINTVTNVTNVKNVTNITNVSIVAPASATANGQAVNKSVPAQAHLAAALPAVVKTIAPEPAWSKPIPAYVAGRAPAALPPPQMVRAELTQVHPHGQVPEPAHAASLMPSVPLAHATGAIPASPPTYGNDPENSKPPISIKVAAVAALPTLPAANLSPTARPPIKPTRAENRLAHLDQKQPEGKSAPAPHQSSQLAVSQDKHAARSEPARVSTQEKKSHKEEKHAKDDAGNAGKIKYERE